MTARLRQSAASLARSFSNRDLRRLQLAWLGSSIGNWGYLVALSVYAYTQGGAGAVGLIWLLRLIPSAVLSAPLATLADRYPRRRVMVVADLARAVAMLVAAAVVVQDGPPAAVYAVVVVATVIGVPFRPAQAALVPRLARDADELTAANVASSTIEAVASFAGPALGGLLLAVSSTQMVFALNALSFVWSALLVVGIRVDDVTATPQARAGFLTELRAGAGTIARDPDVRAVSLLYTLQTLVAGALNVLVVVLALEELETGEVGVGSLNAALGIGGVLGGFAALVLSLRHRLATDLGLGLVLFGLPIALAGVVPVLPVALFALAVVGVGNSLVDVAAITLLQRLVGDQVLGRVLGTLEGMLIGAIGLGAVFAPALANGLGTRGALIATGAVLPLATVLFAYRLRLADRRSAPPAHLETLRGVPFLSVLPEHVLERLAGDAATTSFASGETVILAGDVGDRFYIVETGEVAVEGRRLGPGDAFGEIALLRAVPRTATVEAVTDVRLVSIERDAFVAAVTGHESAAAGAEELISARLGSFTADVRGAR